MPRKTEFFLNNDDIYAKLKDILITEFELDADSIGLEKRWNEDLELDSLDAVDVLISLEDYLDVKIDPALFKDARTVQDMVDLLKPFWK